VQCGLDPRQRVKQRLRLAQQLAALLHVLGVQAQLRQCHQQQRVRIRTVRPHLPYQGLQ
jgi:hypothetical protein